MADQTVKLKLSGDTEDLRKELDKTGRSLDELGSDGTAAGADIEKAVTGADQKVGSLRDSLGEAGTQMGALGGAAAGIGIVVSLENATVASGKLQAQLGLTAEQAEQFDDVAKRVYGNNFGDTMGEAAQLVGQVQQSLGLTGDALEATTEGVFAIADAFGHLGADSNIILEDVRALTRNFPGLDEAEALDLIAAGFQSGAGSAGDLQDVLQEYPQDFARLGLTAGDMLGILDAGMESGVRNADIMADSIRELGINISTAGGSGQQALAEMFPQAEANRLIDNLNAGGDAGRDAFFTIMDGLTAVQDPQDRYNLALQLMGTRGEEVANALPGMRDALLDVRDGTFEAEGAVESLNAQYTGMRSFLEGFKRQIETSFVGPVLEAGGGAAEAATGVGTLALGLQGLGVSVGDIRSKLSNMSGFLLGPWGAALAVATIGVGLFVKSKQEAAERVDELRRTLDEQTGALTDNTEALAINRLQEEGAISAARELGISMESLVGAALGVPGAMADVDDAINGDLAATDSRFGAEEAIQTLTGSIPRLRDELGEATDAAREQLEATAELEGRYLDVGHAIDQVGDTSIGTMLYRAQEAADGLRDAADAAGDTEEAVEGAGDAFDETAEQTLTAAEAIDEYVAANRRATDPVFRLMDAIQQVDDAQQQYNDAVDEYGAGSDEAADAATNLMRRLGDLESAAIDGDVSFTEFEDQLDRWVASGRITETQAGLIRDRVLEAREEADKFEGTREMVINASGNAWEKLELLRRKITEIPQDLVTFGSGVIVEERAEGGPVMPGRPYLVGEEGPELVTFGQRGMVHTAETTGQLMAGGVGSSTAVTIPVMIDVDGVAREVGRSQAFIDAHGRTTLKRARLTADV